MNEDHFKLAEGLISSNYVKQSQQAVQKTQKKITTLLSQRKLPTEGWNDSLIELFLAQLAQMDSNNFPTNIGVGEREGRVYSPLVQKRNYFFTHGIGRFLTMNLKLFQKWRYYSKSTKSSRKLINVGIN
jgi:O-phospho-L-seryl-tRNASec:L-selenocysteinyl-tRNA synthase